MTKTKNNILQVIAIAILVLFGQVAFAQQATTTSSVSTGKASSAGFRLTPEMIAEQERKTVVPTETMKIVPNPTKEMMERAAPSSTGFVSDVGTPSSSSSTSARYLNMLGYAIIAIFFWLTGITIFLFKKR